MKTVMTMRLLNWDMSLTRLLRRGFVTEAVNAVINELREMGFKKVVAGFFERNIGGRKVMENYNFQLTELFRTKDWWIRKCLLQGGDNWFKTV